MNKNLENSANTSFHLLKKEIEVTVNENLGIHKKIEDWSLNDIRDFQTDLEQKCKSTVSEKWIYTHFKKNHHKLPRIDVLHLLSAYCGYQNWDDFLEKNKTDEKQNEPKDKRKLPSGFFGIVIIIALGLGFWLWPKQPSCTVYFIDAYTQDTIPIQTLNLNFKGKMMRAKSPNPTLRKTADTLIASGIFYKQRKFFVGGDADTFQFALFPDDYAMMLNFFSRTESENWQKRRAQLMEAIHPEAKIFQSHPQFEGIELLNREEFIDRLILPTNGLKNLEIQDIVYKDEKIYRLRFVQK